MGSIVSRAGALAGVVAVAVVVTGSAGSAASSREQTGAVAVRLDAQLRALQAGRRVDGLELRGGRVEVTVQARTGRGSRVPAAVRRADGVVERAYRGLSTAL